MSCTKRNSVNVQKRGFSSGALNQTYAWPIPRTMTLR